MVKLKRSDIRILDDAFGMNSGYVLDFSDRTMAEYFEDEFNIDIESGKYRANGDSKAKRLRTFIAREDAGLVSHVIRNLWEYREGIYDENAQVKQRLFSLLTEIEGEGATARTDAIERFTPDQTLDELVGAIERDILANKPVAALDRLHTYCMKKFGHLLDQKKVSWERKEPLHSRVGKYVKALEHDQKYRKMTLQIVKNSISVFDKFNDIRNNQSLAHDNNIISNEEARFIFDSVSAILRFIKATDSIQFGT